eukprot:5914276-Pleurochrysis_carterae.AAC.2
MISVLSAFNARCSELCFEALNARRYVALDTCMNDGAPMCAPRNVTKLDETTSVRMPECTVGS